MSTITPVPSGVPAALHYAHELYKLLAEDAELKTIDHNIPGWLNSEQPLELWGTEQLVWVGKLMDVFNSMNVSQNYYTDIRKIWIRYGCVAWLVRGTKAYDSVIILKQPPPPPQDFTKEVLTGPAAPARMGDIEDRLARLESWRESLGGLNIAEAVKGLQAEINGLAAQLGNIDHSTTSNDNTNSN